MTDLYIRPGTAPQPLPPVAYDAQGLAWTDLANSEEGREATGWNRLAPAKPADTETQTSEWDGDEWVMVNRPPVPPEPEPRYFTFKGDIWRRVTDEEAAELDTDLTALPPRLRRLWDDSSQINHDDEYGQLLIATMTDRWGAARVAEIMAPSGQI